MSESATRLRAVALSVLLVCSVFAAVPGGIGVAAGNTAGNDSGGEAGNAPAAFDVEITGTNEPVRAGETVDVTVTVTNTGDEAGTQTVRLFEDGGEVEEDSEEITLDSGESRSVTLSWETAPFDEGETELTVESGDDSDTRTVTVLEPRVDRFASSVDVTSPQVADGSDPATVTVRVNETDGTPVTGLDGSDFDVDVDATVGDVTETSPGVYEFTLTSTASGPVFVRVDVEGVPIGTVGEGEFGGDAPVTYFIEPGTAYFDVEITETNEPVTGGETLTVTARVTNEGDTGGGAPVTLQVIEGLEPVRDGSPEPLVEQRPPEFGLSDPVAGDGVELGAGESTTVDLDWESDPNGGYYRVRVRAADPLLGGEEGGAGGNSDTRVVWVDIPPEEPSGILAAMEGDGTTEDPYVITNVTELQAMQHDTHANYVLGNDIDASDTSAWNESRGFAPVGGASLGEGGSFLAPRVSFTGSFDGQNHRITNLTIDRPEEQWVGLFGFAQEARIENVALVDANVTGGDGVGGLAGGQFGSTISETAADGNVTGDIVVGGLVGGNDGTVERSYATGEVTARDSVAGGLVGSVGLIGSGIGLESEIAPETTPTVTASYATSDVTGLGSGPLVGLPPFELRSSVRITEAYATGSLTTPDREGELPPPEEGELPPPEVRDPVREAPVEVTASDVYWDTLAIGVSEVPYGTGLETAQLTGTAAATNLEGFDFADTWVLTDSYPRLQWALDDVAVSPTDTTLEVDETTGVSVTASFVDGTTETATTTADYSSSDTGVVTVDDDGTITAVGAGTATVTATVGDQQATTSVTVPEPVESEPSSSGGGGGGGGGADDSRDITVEQTETGWQVTVSGARRNTTVPAAFDEPDDRQNLTVTDVRLNVSRGGYFQLDLTTEDGDDGAPGFESGAGAQAVGTVTVDHTISDSDVDNVTFAFRVRKDALGETDPESVALYRQGPDGWTRLPTAFTGETDTHLEFRSLSPGLSVFAVGTPGPAFDVSDATVADTAVQTGESTDVTVTVANRGSADGTYALDLAADGATVASQSVDVPAGESRTVTLSPSFETAGNYGLTVGNVTVGDVSVQAQTATDEGATGGSSGTTAAEATTDAGPGTEPAGLNPAILGVVVVLVVGIAAVGVARYRGLLE